MANRMWCRESSELSRDRYISEEQKRRTEVPSTRRHDDNASDRRTNGVARAKTTTVGRASAPLETWEGLPASGRRHTAPLSTPRCADVADTKKQNVRSQRVRTARIDCLAVLSPKNRTVARKNSRPRGQEHRVPHRHASSTSIVPVTRGVNRQGAGVALIRGPVIDRLIDQ